MNLEIELDYSFVDHLSVKLISSIKMMMMIIIKIIIISIIIINIK